MLGIVRGTDAGSWVAPNRRVDAFLGVAPERLEMCHVSEALRVDLVDVLRPGRARRKPAVLGHDFQAVDWSVVPRSAGQFGDDGLTSQARLLDGLRRQDLQARFLLGCCG